MKSLLRFLVIKRNSNLQYSEPTKNDSGFTMIELLVGAILTFLIISPLMGFVVSILNDDRVEQVKTTTDQEMKTALDYITEDVSQAIHIYNQEVVTEIANQLPTVANGTPILVFWKRQLIQDALPVVSTNQPVDCVDTNDRDCNDTFVLSLVAYYLIEGNNDPTWCTPASTGNAPCPSRIARFQIQDGVDWSGGTCEPNSTECKDSQKRDEGFEAPELDDLDNWTKSGEAYTNTPEVLVNYIDQSTANVPAAPNCQTILSSTTAEILTTNSNSFLACVDTDQNLAYISLRGNALRRFKTNANDIVYNAEKKAYFPTYSTTVKGVSRLGGD
ncbi:MAG: hormogonium polysaccharide secretion pseudopilin HpsC [Limnoraphis robusta]